MSVNRKPIGVPKCAVKVSSGFRTSSQSAKPAPPVKRRKNGYSGSKSPMVEMNADLEFLFSDDETPPAEEERKYKGKAVEMSVLLYLAHSHTHKLAIAHPRQIPS
jgi:ubiquitin-conjugating enzyme E2 Q